MRGIEHLHPKAQEKARALQRLCAERNIPLLITETWRTTAEQDALYAKGRTAPGNIVTNCKGSTYSSPHQWGVAFDFCRNVKGQEYNDSDGFFKTVGTLAKSVGLFWGGDFKSFVDKPHLELASEFLPSNSTATLKSKYSIPEKFKATWTAQTTPPVVTPENKEDDTVKQADFNKMMDAYLAEQRAKPISNWAKEEWDKAVKAGVFDGTAPQGFMTREQVAVLLVRQGLIK